MRTQPDDARELLFMCEMLVVPKEMKGWKNQKTKNQLNLAALSEISMINRIE